MSFWWNGTGSCQKWQISVHLAIKISSKWPFCFNDCKVLYFCHFQARQLKVNHPSWGDERLFNEARKWTIAVYQVRYYSMSGNLSIHLHLHIYFEVAVAFDEVGTRSGFIRGCAAPGSEPLPYFRDSWTREVVRTLKTYLILRKIS